MTSPRFSNTILVPGTSGQSPSIQTFGALDQPRKKRPHRKSRKGCDTCKRRKVKRNEQCFQPHHISVAIPIVAKAIDPVPWINLMHLELFHHWDKETRSTLAFPQIWPVVMQQAFHEDFVMSAILCTSAMHFSSLCPHEPKYRDASGHLMAKTVQLFRKNLSRPFNKQNCEALMGTALLVNYISWFDLDFLHGQTKLDLSKDQLFFLTPGIIELWFRSMPIFIDQGSIFADVARHSPRFHIEQALVSWGHDPERFVGLLMDIWDDPRYQGESGPLKSDEPTSCAWRLLLGMENQIPHTSPKSPPAEESCEEDTHNQSLTHLKEVITDVTDKFTSPTHPAASMVLSSQSDRSVFETLLHRISPLLCCALLAAGPIRCDMTSISADIEELFFGVPVLCSGPIACWISDGDSRILVLLCHFYRAAQILLSKERNWWGYTRSCVMERLILDELKSRGLHVDLLI
uniref:Zn(2)-C6 fungal-type domain-containing protein n=1 Tax=Fusarium oxysporum (strain Fo5176) TaxID=660025 RepID=A0A0D2Y6C0_FUSOF